MRLYSLFVAMFGLLFLFLACGPGKKIETTEPFPGNNGAQMVFLDYYVAAGRGSAPEVELRSIIFQAGSIKGEGFQTGMAVPESGVQCLQRGEDGTILHQLVFENPLIKRVEFVNEQGDFEQKTIRLDSTHLLIRTMLHPATEEILLADEKQPVTKKSILHNYPKDT